jgi:hypothetical protein
MKYDVRIVKGEESRSLSVFFKADVTAKGPSVAMSDKTTTPTSGAQFPGKQRP